MNYEKKVLSLLAALILLGIVIVALLYSFSFPNSKVLHDSLIGYYLLYISMAIVLTFTAIAYIVSIINQERKDMFLNIVNQAENDKEGYNYLYDEYIEIKENYLNQVREVNRLEKEFESKKIKFSEYANEIEEINLRNSQKIDKVKVLETQYNEKVDAIKSIIDSLEGYFWVTDFNGIILSANDSLINEIPGIVMGKDRLEKILKMDGMESEIFSRRNYNNVHAVIENERRQEIVVTSTRMFEGYSLTRIVFVAHKYSKDNQTDNFIKISRNLTFISEISEIICQNTITEKYIHTVLQRICEYSKLRSASVSLIRKPSNDFLDKYTSYSHSKEPIAHKSVPIEGTHAGRCFKLGRPIIINNLQDILFEEKGVVELVKQGNKLAYFPLKLMDKVTGVLNIIRDSELERDCLLLIDSITINLTIALEKVFLYDKLKKNFFETVEAVLTAFEMKVNYLKGHSGRVAQICKILAQHLFYEPHTVDDLYTAALLHDVGKIAFDDDSEKYYFDIHEHSILGSKIMEEVGVSDEVLKAIRYHHSDYYSEEGVAPLYAQFIRLANDLDIFLSVEPTYDRAMKFVKKICRRNNYEYSPQLVNLLDEILNSPNDKILKIYREAVNEQI